MNTTILKQHLPGLSTAAALTLIPSVAEAVEPGSLPAMGPDSPAWALPVVMGLTYLGSKIVEIVLQSRAHDTKAKEAEIARSRERIAQLVAEKEEAQTNSLDQSRRIYQLEADLEAERAIHAAQSATDLASPRSNHDPS